jgi:hypothetical protein
MKKHSVLLTITVVTTALIVAAIIAVATYDGCVLQPRDRNECIDGGGHVILIHGGHGGWFCQERSNAERAP